MARKRIKKTGEYEGATCCRCELPLDAREGTCPNRLCPYHFGLQDEVIDDEGQPSKEELKYIEEIRARLDKEA